jgi:hypothetical protein
VPKLEIKGFDGLVPRMSGTMLQDNQAQEATNVKLYSKELRYWRGPALVYTPLVGNVLSIYRLYGSSTSKWLTWTTAVDVVPGPNAVITDFPVYYTGDGVPKKTNYALASTGGGPYPAASYAIGVPAPTAAPTLAQSAGSSVGAELRAYVYTFVSTFGSISEESAPSPAASINLAISKQVDISAMQTAPGGSYNITSKRIYRTVTGATTSTYQFVAEVPIATTTYTDNLLVAALGGVVPSIGWLPPPATLAGLVALPCGSLAGFSGNTVYFSEPFFPHAWPVAYGLSVPFNIVGLGVEGNTIVVMTDRYPYIITGPYPGAYSVEQVPILEPCVSKASIVSDEMGVIYASPNGLVGIGPTMRGIITNSLFRRDEWQAVFPTLIKGASYDGKYFALYPTNDHATMVISRDDTPALSYFNQMATTAYVDSRTANLYYVDATTNGIYQIDSDDLNPITYQWRSRRFVLPQGITWSALRLDADYSQITADAVYTANLAAILAANATIYTLGLHGELNDHLLNEILVNGDDLFERPTVAGSHYAQVHVYGDNMLQASLTMGSLDPVRMPPFRCRELEIKIVGTINVRAVSLATTLRELRTQ